MNQKIIEYLRGTIDINQRQQAEEELDKVRNFVWFSSSPRFPIMLCVSACVPQFGVLFRE